MGRNRLGTRRALRFAPSTGGIFLPRVGPYSNLAPVDGSKLSNVHYFDDATVTSSRLNPIKANNLIIDPGVTVSGDNYSMWFWCINVVIGAGAKFSVNGANGFNAPSASQAGDGGNGSSGGGGGLCDTIGTCGNYASGGNGTSGASGQGNGNCSFPATGGAGGEGFGTTYMDAGNPFIASTPVGGANANGDVSTGAWGRGGNGSSNTCFSTVSAGGGGGGAGYLNIVAYTCTSDIPEINFTMLGAAPGAFFDSGGDGSQGGSGGGVGTLFFHSYDGKSLYDASGGSSCCGSGHPGLAKIWQINPDNSITPRTFGVPFS